MAPIAIGANNRNELCANAHGERVIKIARNVAEGVIHRAMSMQVNAMRCEKYARFQLYATLHGTAPVTLCTFLATSCEKYAKQVAEKIHSVSGA